MQQSRAESCAIKAPRRKRNNQARRMLDQYKVPLELKLWRCVGERSGVPDMSQEYSFYEGPLIRRGLHQGTDWAGPSRTLRSSERIAAKITGAGQEARPVAKTSVVNATAAG